MKSCAAGAVAFAVVVSWAFPAALFANGGPFVVQYPNGDPAAKGIVARLDPDLKPARENRLRVKRENLDVVFTEGGLGFAGPAGPSAGRPPLAKVSATYVIENPTDKSIQVDFGFPILRGIYMHPLSMTPRPDVVVRIDEEQVVYPQVISNSAIYGLIRQRAREVIEAGIARDDGLATRVAAVRATGLVRRRARATISAALGEDRALAGAVQQDPLLGGLVAPVSARGEPDHAAARQALAAYLSDSLHWSDSDVALMVEYAGLDVGNRIKVPWDRSFFSWGPGRELMDANLGALAAIGEQKATQFFAVLASRFDPDAGRTYEAIFTAWGGDVRERSVDLATGNVRPREISVDAEDVSGHAGAAADPTIYARVDYLDPDANITEAQKASCQAVLKHLPVIFTFAPMNLLHYDVTFPAGQTRTLTVSYKQHAYADTRAPESYQLAYVIHPASLWEEFGPIHLTVAVPEGVPFRASVDCPKRGTEQKEIGPERGSPGPTPPSSKRSFDVYEATLNEKTGELFLALDAGAWKTAQPQAADLARAGRRAED
jgi:hypothetical protein